MHLTTWQLAGTVLATGLTGLLVWLVTVPLRGRSVTGLVASVVVTGPLAVLGGIGWALLLGPRAVAGPSEAMALAAVAVVVAGVESGIGAARAHRRLARGQDALRATLVAMATGDVPATDGPRLLAELETVRCELADVARTLAAARRHDHALDRSRRELIAWVSHDLHAPLTVLRAMSETEPGPDPVVRAELDRLVGVVDDLFDLATAPGRGADTAVVSTRPAPVVLAEVLGDAVAAVAPLARLRDVAIHVQGSSRAHVGLLDADGTDLGRRLIALLVDAIRHSEPGSRLGVEISPGEREVRIDLRPGHEPARGLPAPAGPDAVRAPAGRDSRDGAATAGDAVTGDAAAGDAVAGAPPLAAVHDLRRFALHLPVLAPAV